MKHAVKSCILIFSFVISGESAPNVQALSAGKMDSHILSQDHTNSPKMGKTIFKDFARFSEDDWVPVSGTEYSTPGKFLQEKGGIRNYYPESTDTSRMFSHGTGYAMRLLKGVQVRNGRAESELMLMGFAAPSILVRSQVKDGTNYESYYCVVYNQSTPKKRYEGINLWVFRGEWKLLKELDLDIPRNKKIKFAVEFVDHQLTFFLNDKMVGTVNDPAPVSEGSVGIVSMEGPNYFYNFSFTE
jgi:hypothetical protein